MASSELFDRVRALELRIADLEGLLGARKRPGGSWSKHVAGWLDIETRLGLTWFNRLGAVALVAALALAAAWANDQGYLSPTVRSVLAAGVAAGLLALACWKLRGARGARRAFLTGVALIGAGGLLVVPATAALVDGLIAHTVAMALLVTVVAGCLVLAAAFDVYALALLATVGGAAVPLVSGTGEPKFSLVMVYLAALAASAVAVQLYRRWTALDALAILALSAYSLAWSGLDPSLASASWSGAVWAAALGYEAWRRKVERVRRTESQRVRVLLAAAVAGGIGLLATGAAWVVVGFVTAHVWVWRDPRRPRMMVPLLALCAAGAVAFPSALSAAIMLPLLWQAIRRDEPVLAAITAVTTAWVWASLGLELSAAGLATVAVAAYATTCVFIGIDERKRSKWLANALIASGGVCGVIAAWPLASALAPANVSLVMTLTATAVGLVLVVVGMLCALKLVRAAGLSFLGLVAAKLVIVDIWALSSGTRVLALCALGFGSLAVSFLYSRVVSSRDGETANC